MKKITSQSSRDPLFSHIKSRLENLNLEFSTESALIFEVVAVYMSELMAMGNIPHYMLDDLECDLREEAVEIYRKLTYGYHSIDDYRKGQDRRKKARAS